MKKHMLGLAVAAGALWVWAPGCDQPTPECTVGTASAAAYAAKYTLVSADPPNDPENPCVSPGDLVGMQVYNPDSGGKPDSSTKKLAIQAATLGDMIGAYQSDADETHKPYSLGTFNDVEPDSNDMCTVPTLSVAQQVLGEVACFPNGSECEEDFECCSEHCDGETETCATPIDECEGTGGGGTGGGGTGGGGTGGGDGTGGGGGGPGGPPIQTTADLSYEWSNVNIYVTASSLGNQAQADLTIRDAVSMCTATYKVTMLWPAVGCEKLAALKSAHPPDEGDPDDPCDDDPGVPCDPAVPDTCLECDLATDPDCEAIGTGEPEGKLCDDEPDPEAVYGLPTGSGISPDLRVKCDPDLLLCVLDSTTIPASR